MKATFCPRCGGSDLYLEAGGMSGAYVCKECGYRGALIIEKDIVQETKE